VTSPVRNLGFAAQKDMTPDIKFLIAGIKKAARDA
jgi:hypothetical protein